MAFVPDRTFFDSSRRVWDPRVGRVARRRTGGTAASRIIANSRSVASSRLRGWDRKRCALITITPSCVIRLPAIRISLVFTPSGRDGDPRASNRNSTAVETLFTFCPPGPELSTKRSLSSASSIDSDAVMGRRATVLQK